VIIYNKLNLIVEKNLNRTGASLTQVIECLPSKIKVLNPSTFKKLYKTALYVNICLVHDSVIPF
jgi:hypothetical protein